jgi:hypothetical protein
MRSHVRLALQAPDPWPHPSKVGYLPYALKKQVASAGSKTPRGTVSPVILQTAVIHIAIDSCAPAALSTTNR